MLLIMSRLFYNYFSLRYCIGNGYDIRYITNTIQTIGRDGDGKHRWFLRGKIDKFYANEYYVVGYLSIKNFKEDRLVGLEGEYDKEGYFIVELKYQKVWSGLSEHKFDLLIHRFLNMDAKKINYKKLPVFSFACLFDL